MPYINNGDIELYYEVVGTGKPIIFHHGFGNSIPDFYELGYVDGLKDHFQLVLLDCRGFGKSSKPHDPELYTLDRRCSDTIAVMDALNIDKAVAFGNSMGGLMVYGLMQYYPERFESFIAAGADPHAESSELVQVFLDALRQGMQYTVDMIENNFGPFPFNMRERYLQNDPQAMLAVYAKPLIDTSPALSKIDAPVLLYAGSEDPVVEQMQQASQLLKNGQLKLIEGFDHAQAYWRGDVAADLIIEFLKD